jgi:hypothetical protein
MIADIDRDDLLVVDQQLQRDAVRKVDGYRVQPLQPAAQGVQAQRGMVRVHFQQLQRLEVLFFQLGMALEKTRGASVVLSGEDQLESHDRLLLMPGTF